MPSKAANQRYHAKCRAAERYGLTLTCADLKLMVQTIQSGKSQLIERQSNRLSVRVIEYQGVKVKVVYDRNRSNIVTFLPQDTKESEAG